MEKGDSAPSAVVLVRLAEVLGTSADHLLGLDDAPPVVRPEPSPWLAALLPELEALDKSGQEAVKALIKGFKKS
jgi:transcriptional regulator with XRE-family HTH domain